MKSMMKNTLKKNTKPLRAANEYLIKFNSLLKEATFTAERVVQQNKDFEGTNRLQKAQYDEILKMVEAKKSYEVVPEVLEVEGDNIDTIKSEVAKKSCHCPNCLDQGY